MRFPYHRVTASLHEISYHRITALPCHHITTLLHHCVTTSLCWSVICLAPCHQTSQSFDLPSTTTSLHEISYHCITTLPCYCITALPCHHITALLHHHITVLLHHCITALPCHCITTLVSHLPCPLKPHNIYHVTVSLCYRISESFDLTSANPPHLLH